MQSYLHQKPMINGGHMSMLTPQQQMAMQVQQQQQQQQYHHINSSHNVPTVTSHSQVQLQGTQQVQHQHQVQQHSTASLHMLQQQHQHVQDHHLAMQHAAAQQQANHHSHNNHSTSAAVNNTTVVSSSNSVNITSSNSPSKTRTSMSGIQAGNSNGSSGNPVIVANEAIGYVSMCNDPRWRSYTQEELRTKVKENRQKFIGKEFVVGHLAQNLLSNNNVVVAGGEPLILDQNMSNNAMSDSLSGKIVSVKGIDYEQMTFKCELQGSQQGTTTSTREHGTSLSSSKNNSGMRFAPPTRGGNNQSSSVSANSSTTAQSSHEFYSAEELENKGDNNNNSVNNVHKHSDSKSRSPKRSNSNGGRKVNDSSMSTTASGTDLDSRQYTNNASNTNLTNINSEGSGTESSDITVGTKNNNNNDNQDENLKEPDMSTVQEIVKLNIANLIPIQYVVNGGARNSVDLNHQNNSSSNLLQLNQFNSNSKNPNDKDPNNRDSIKDMNINLTDPLALVNSSASKALSFDRLERKLQQAVFFFKGQIPPNSRGETPKDQTIFNREVFAQLSQRYRSDELHRLDILELILKGKKFHFLTVLCKELCVWEDEERILRLDKVNIEANHKRLRIKNMDAARSKHRLKEQNVLYASALLAVRPACVGSGVVHFDQFDYGLNQNKQNQNGSGSSSNGQSSSSTAVSKQEQKNIENAIYTRLVKYVKYGMCERCQWYYLERGNTKECTPVPTSNTVNTSSHSQQQQQQQLQLQNSNHSSHNVTSSQSSERENHSVGHVSSEHRNSYSGSSQTQHTSQQIHYNPHPSQQQQQQISQHHNHSSYLNYNPQSTLGGPNHLGNAPQLGGHNSASSSRYNNNVNSTVMSNSNSNSTPVSSSQFKSPTNQILNMSGAPHPNGLVTSSVGLNNHLVSSSSDSRRSTGGSGGHTGGYQSGNNHRGGGGGIQYSSGSGSGNNMQIEEL